MRFLTSLLALTLTTTATAADPGFALEFGGTRFATQDMMPIFRDDGMATPGATAFLQLSDLFRVQLGYQYSSTASHLSQGDDYYEDEYGGTNGVYLPEVHFFLSEHRALPGIRVNAGTRRFVPYAELNGVIGTAALWIDDDDNRRTNPGQVKERAMVLGVQPIGGLELQLPFGPPSKNAALGINYEMGWSFETAPTYTVGALSHGGLVIRGGVSLRI